MAEPEQPATFVPDAASDVVFPRARYDDASLRCASSLPVRTVESSRYSGWKTLLLEHQEVLAAENAFQTACTTDHTIVVMTRGEQHLEAFVDGRWKETIYRPGSVGITPAGTIDRLRRRVIGEAGSAWKVNLYLPPAVVDEAARELGFASKPFLGRPSHATAYSDQVLRTASMTLLQALRGGAPSLYADSMCYWLAVHLLTTRNGRNSQSDIATASMRDRRLTKVLDFMEHHHGEDITLDRLAVEATISKFHFVRLFREATGMTPHQWLIRRRLETGRQLVLDGDLSMTEIALRCGFKRANHFTSAYKKRFGLPPLTHRGGGKDEILRS